jgi:hypothetical protein
MLAYLSFKESSLFSLLLGEPRVSRRNVFLVLNMALVKMNRAKTDIPPAIRLSVVSGENDVRETILLDTCQKSREGLSCGRYEPLLPHLDLHVMIPNP